MSCHFPTNPCIKHLNGFSALRKKIKIRNLTHKSQNVTFSPLVSFRKMVLLCLFPQPPSTMPPTSATGPLHVCFLCPHCLDSLPLSHSLMSLVWFMYFFALGFLSSNITSSGKPFLTFSIKSDLQYATSRYCIGL